MIFSRFQRFLLPLIAFLQIALADGTNPWRHKVDPTFAKNFDVDDTHIHDRPSKILTVKAQPSRSVRCDRCLPGYGLRSACNVTHIAVCERCQPGVTFSTDTIYHRRPCQACSLCGHDLYVDFACTPSRDTVCDSCENGATREGSSENEDFVRKCWFKDPDSDEVMATTEADVKLLGDEEEVVASTPIDPRHNFWRYGDGAEPHAEVRFKPSYSEYNVDELIHAHRRKAYILIAMLSFVLFATLAFTVWFVKCRSSRTQQQQRTQFYARLSDQDRELIAASAQKLQASSLYAPLFEQNKRKYSGRTPLLSTSSLSSVAEHADGDVPTTPTVKIMRVVENPLDDLPEVHRSSELN